MQSDEVEHRYHLWHVVRQLQLLGFLASAFFGVSGASE